jgi:hypothetical protein
MGRPITVRRTGSVGGLCDSLDEQEESEPRGDSCPLRLVIAVARARPDNALACRPERAPRGRRCRRPHPGESGSGGRDANAARLATLPMQGAGRGGIWRRGCSSSTARPAERASCLHRRGKRSRPRPDRSERLRRGSSWLEAPSPVDPVDGPRPHLEDRDDGRQWMCAPSTWLEGRRGPASRAWRNGCYVRTASPGSRPTSSGPCCAECSPISTRSTKTLSMLDCSPSTCTRMFDRQRRSVPKRPRRF